MENTVGDEVEEEDEVEEGGRVWRCLRRNTPFQLDFGY